MTFDEFVEKVATFEGFRPTVYNDSGGVPTIGYGFTEDKFIGMGTMTKEYAKSLLREKLIYLKKDVESKLEKWGYIYNNNMLLALTDFTYNCGMGNLLQLTDNGKRTLKTISEKIVLYNKCSTPKGKIELKGLTTRRHWEQKLFNSEFENVSRETFTNADIQSLCNAIITNSDLKEFTILKVDGIIGDRSREVIFKLLSNLL